jgi:DNA-3-methyladenine glycosylase II
MLIISKLKGKGGKWKYMSEKEMEEIAAKFSPYRYVTATTIRLSVY